MSRNTARERVFELDVLRFSAAVGVVLYHLTYRIVDGQRLYPELDFATRYGFLGVVLFFMISGFVILWTAVGRTPGQFVISRFSRLYPIFWVAIAITMIGIGLLSETRFELTRILANMTMVAGYLDQPYIDAVYWTLQVELKFYLIIFVLLILRQLDNMERWLLVWLLASVAAWKQPYIGSLTIHPYGPYFISGATLFLVWRDGFTPLRVLLLLGCLPMCMIEIWTNTHKFIYSKDSFYPLMCCLITFCLYALMTAIALGHVRIGERPFLFRLAMMTYPLYLLHNKFGKQLYNALDAGRYTALVIVLVSVFLMCYLLAMYVDRPLNRLSNRLLNGLRARFAAAG